MVRLGAHEIGDEAPPPRCQCPLESPPGGARAGARVSDQQRTTPDGIKDRATTPSHAAILAHSTSGVTCRWRSAERCRAHDAIRRAARRTQTRPALQHAALERRSLSAWVRHRSVHNGPEASLALAGDRDICIAPSLPGAPYQTRSGSKNDGSAIAQINATSSHETRTRAHSRRACSVEGRTSLPDRC